LRWVAANAVAELFGLGLTFALIAFAFSRLENSSGAANSLTLFFISVASGAVEATIVGLCQWWAMHPWFPNIARRAWWCATLIGALVAYVLGFLPSTIMSLGGQAVQSSPAVSEPAPWLVLLLAVGLGVAAGAVLSFAQWLTMRKKIGRAGWWIPANMAAWFIGMPVIFWGIDVCQKVQAPFLAVLILAGTLLLTGALVGAIHGIFLVRMIFEPQRS